jgi:hypothetical protein
MKLGSRGNVHLSDVVIPIFNDLEPDDSGMVMMGNTPLKLALGDLRCNRTLRFSTSCL